MTLEERVSKLEADQRSSGGCGCFLLAVFVCAMAIWDWAWTRDHTDRKPPIIPDIISYSDWKAKNNP